jgi:hypothetical protein
MRGWGVKGATGFLRPIIPTKLATSLVTLCVKSGKE